MTTNKKTAIAAGITATLATLAFVFRNKTIGGLGAARVVRTYHGVNRANPGCKNKSPRVFITEEVRVSKSASEKAYNNVQVDAKWGGVYQFSR